MTARVRTFTCMLFIAGAFHICTVSTFADQLSDQFNSCKSGLTATNAIAIAAVDMSCMDAATKYAERAHRAALAKHLYDRDRYRLLAGSSYVAAWNLESRLGDNGDAHDDYTKGIAFLRLAASSHYRSIANTATRALAIAENR